MSSKSYLNPGDWIGKHRQEEELGRKVSRALSAVSPVPPAKLWYERLQKQILAFESELDANMEVAANLVSFAGAHTFHITELGFHAPDMIIFHGTNGTGQKMRLLQHVAQINILLMAVPTLGEKPHRIGFMENEGV